VKDLEHEEAFSASRLPQQSEARNIALTGINKNVTKENTITRGMPLEWKNQ
jgi:hypothetical protein